MGILSIQSHVVYGYVGNRAATFPLQRLGHEVYTINTVQFSNHTGYGKWRGEIFSPEHIAELAQGLADLGVLLECQAVLSGYLGKPEIGHEVLRIVQTCRQANPKLTYLCDPVMGDVGRGIFVDSQIPAFIKAHAVPQASILTPNHFEMELLVGHSIQSLEEARLACINLRSHSQQIIVITSFKREDAPPNILEMFLSTLEGCFLITTPYLDFPKPPNGTGDLFSALFLGHYLQQNDPVSALELSASSIYGILAFTFSQKLREMQIIKAQAELVQPKHKFKCQKLFN